MRNGCASGTLIIGNSIQHRDGNLYNIDKTMLIQYAIGKTATEFVIPDGVTHIGEGAFSRCDSLTTVTIPEGVTNIRESAFSYCSSLMTVIILNAKTFIGNYIFRECDNLTSVYYIGSPEEWTKICDSYYNSVLANATQYYYKETEPLVGGNYWHYNKNGEIVIWE